MVRTVFINVIVYIGSSYFYLGTVRLFNLERHVPGILQIFSLTAECGCMCPSARAKLWGVLHELFIIYCVCACVSCVK